MAQSDGEWRGIIDPDEVDRNWWILNHSRFGSGHFLSFYVCSLWVAIVAVEGTLWLWYYLSEDVAVQVTAITLDVVIVVVPLLLTVYIRQTLPDLRDRLRIKQVLHFIPFFAFSILPFCSLKGAEAHFPHRRHRGGCVVADCRCSGSLGRCRRSDGGSDGVVGGVQYIDFGHLPLCLCADSMGSPQIPTAFTFLF